MGAIAIAGAIIVMLALTAVALRRRAVRRRRPRRVRGFGPLAAMGEVVTSARRSAEGLPAVAEPHQAYLRIVDAPTTERRRPTTARRRRPTRPSSADPANAVPLKELVKRATTV